jgi:thiol-disulfide isomerase/thioredoxin
MAVAMPKPDLPEEPVAPLVDSAVWLNTPNKAPLVWENLRGQVVMVEFWTIGCINCQHVIPSMISMYADYKARGFTILGVHAPEFDYEKKLANVTAAVKKWGIEYPVAIDNDFENWNRYRNRYWPALYLVDKRGVVRHTHIGEGGDAETRQWIETLLAES